MRNWWCRQAIPPRASSIQEVAIGVKCGTSKNRVRFSIAIPWVMLGCEALGIMEPNQIAHSDPEILGGTPVFVGTRVPVQTLLVYLEKGETIETFLDNFPTVSREQVVSFLEEAGRALLARIA